VKDGEIEMKAMKFAAGLLAAAALAACATTEAQHSAAQPFDPAACYTRDFSVYFDGLDTELSREARGVVDLTVDALRGCRIEHVRIVGQADARGAEDTSENVSHQRAASIADYLETRGWPRASFELLATGDRGAVTDEGLARPMRRRGHVTVTAVAP
jgi:outer membrane protein OmpA-like peptidoglycan-associated protein